MSESVSWLLDDWCEYTETRGKVLMKNGCQKVHSLHFRRWCSSAINLEAIEAGLSEEYACKVLWLRYLASNLFFYFISTPQQSTRR